MARDTKPRAADSGPKARGKTSIDLRDYDERKSTEQVGILKYVRGPDGDW